MSAISSNEYEYGIQLLLVDRLIKSKTAKIVLICSTDIVFTTNTYLFRLF